MIDACFFHWEMLLLEVAHRNLLSIRKYFCGPIQINLRVKFGLQAKVLTPLVYAYAVIEIENDKLFINWVLSCKKNSSHNPYS